MQLEEVIDKIQTELDKKDTPQPSEEILFHALYNSNTPRLQVAAVAGLGVFGSPEFIDIYVDAINNDEFYANYLRRVGIHALENTSNKRAIPPLLDVLKNGKLRSHHEEAAEALLIIAVNLPEESTQIIQNTVSLIKDPKVDTVAKNKLITDTLTPLTSVASAKKEATQALLSIMRDETIHWEPRFSAAEKIVLAVSWDLVSEAEAREAVEFCTSVFESIMLGAPEPLKEVKLFPGTPFVEIGRGYAVRNIQFKKAFQYSDGVKVIGECRMPAYKDKDKRVTVEFSISLFNALGRYLGGGSFTVYGVDPKGGIYPFEAIVPGAEFEYVEYCQIRNPSAWIFKSKED